MRTPIDCDELQDLFLAMEANRAAVLATDVIMDNYPDGCEEFIEAERKAAALEEEYKQMLNRLEDAGYDEP